MATWCEYTFHKIIGIKLILINFLKFLQACAFAWAFIPMKNKVFLKIDG